MLYDEDDEFVEEDEFPYPLDGDDEAESDELYSGEE